MISTKLIGILSGIIVLFLNSIIPILIQEVKISTTFIVFLLSIVGVIVSFFVMYFFEKSQITNILTLIKNSTTDFKLILLGIIAYLYNYFFYAGVASVNTGIYNTISVFQILIGIFITIHSVNLTMNTYEIIGSIIAIIGILMVIYNEYRISDNKTKNNIFYGSIYLVFVLILCVKNRLEYAKILSNPFSTLFCQNLVMFFISIIIYFIQLWFFTKTIKKTNIKNILTIEKLLYIILVPILIADYIPSLLENAEYDYLSFFYISIFIVIQFLIGFVLDFYYYKLPFTKSKLCFIIIIFIGVFILLYGNYLENKKNKKITTTNTTTPTTNTITPTTNTTTPTTNTITPTTNTITPTTNTITN